MVKHPSLTFAVTSNIDVVDAMTALATDSTEDGSTSVGPLVMEPRAPTAAGSESLSVMAVHMELYGILMFASNFVRQGVAWHTLTGIVSEYHPGRGSSSSKPSSAESPSSLSESSETMLLWCTTSGPSPAPSVLVLLVGWWRGW